MNAENGMDKESQPKKRILAVDDDPRNTQIVKLMLQKRGGYEIVELHDSREAIAVAREFKPDLIVLDIAMPDVDGVDIARQLNADPALREIPFIFLTGLVTAEEPAAGQLFGGYRFLGKPVSSQKLIHCVEELLEQRRTDSAVR